MALKVKELTAEERSAIENLARSRTASPREVERAPIIRLARRGTRVPAIAPALDVTAITVRTWLKHFNAAGLAGLQDRPRAGGPVTSQPEQVSEGIATALRNPQQLTPPCACWTLDRLATFLNEETKMPIKRSRIDGNTWGVHANTPPADPTPTTRTATPVAREASARLR
jgi:transposase